jgi:3-deoxy-D-manno-octulosonate 8-phosphate phosphatase KdsC-like HAD superfamily phosphatase
LRQPAAAAGSTRRPAFLDLCEVEGLDPAQVAGIGDASGDLPWLRTAR